MVPESPLEDPDKAAFAWARYKRLMRRIALVALAFTAAVLLYLQDGDSEASIHYYLAIGLGVFGTIMLTAGLMGLVFLSSGTGHDESVTDLMDDRHRRD